MLKYFEMKYINCTSYFFIVPTQKFKITYVTSILFLQEGTKLYSSKLYIS